jgi:hypothetical protein
MQVLHPFFCAIEVGLILLDLVSKEFLIINTVFLQRKIRIFLLLNFLDMLHLIIHFLPGGQRFQCFKRLLILFFHVLLQFLDVLDLRIFFHS